jgi:polyphosphate kinase
MMLVNESRQGYAQHIEMKEAALMACKDKFHSLTKQVEKAFAEKVGRSSNCSQGQHKDKFCPLFKTYHLSQNYFTFSKTTFPDTVMKSVTSVVILKTVPFTSLYNMFR